MIQRNLLENPHWYAIHTRSRHEHKVKEQFEKKNIVHFLPLVEKLRYWKDRKKLVSFPLFPGYIFGYFPLLDKLKILTTVGVVQIVGFHEGPVPIPEEQISAIQRMITSGLKYDPVPYFKEGQRVRVKRGPLAGVEGILMEKRRKFRLVISVDLIQQSAAMEIDAADVEPVS
ncbi:MAG TPA: UpxY family transcription antiterminator [Candidatus Limnocylindrales bacterium]|nr:UpxY family transcription antiterminator [Candidatus Limnocylindrales bacterium]